MGNFVTVLPYAMFITGILMLLLNAFVFSRIPSNLWANWYHESLILQPIRATLLALFFICYAIFYWTFRHNATFALIIVGIGFAFALLGLIFTIRSLVIIYEKKANKNRLTGE